MNELDELGQGIERCLAAAQDQRRLAQEDMRRCMIAIDEKLRRFGEVADRLVRNVICARVQKMASYFDNVEFLRPEREEQRHSCICRFRPTGKLPATVVLKVSVSPDDAFEQLLVICRVEIEPTCPDFESRDQKAFPMDAIDEAALGRWVDEQLLRFVDTYLCLEEAGLSQTQNLVLDPVCGMVIKKNHAVGQVEHEGRTYYFCVEECQKKFAEQPTRYAPAAT
jgi:YHS domain-containing protein